MKNPPPPEWDGVEHLKSKSHSTQSVSLRLPPAWQFFSMSVGTMQIHCRGPPRLTADHDFIPCHLLTTSEVVEQVKAESQDALWFPWQ